MPAGGIKLVLRGYLKQLSYLPGIFLVSFLSADSLKYIRLCVYKTHLFAFVKAYGIYKNTVIWQAIHLPVICSISSSL